MAVFIEREEYEFLLRSAKFCEKIELYVDALGLDHGEVMAYKSDNEQFNYVFANQTQYGSLAESYMRYKINNMQSRFADLIYLCRTSNHYTKSIGEELGIATAVNPLDSNNFTPVVQADYLSSGQPVLKWEKGDFQGVEIWKNTGDNKGYQKLARSFAQRFIDTSPLPAKGSNCTSWKYSIIYLFKDEMVGNWSDEVEFIVHGLSK